MKQDAYMITRRALVSSMGALALGALLAPAYAEEPEITVHKDPNCGCCSGWVRHLRDAGFVVRVDEAADLELVRVRLGVPQELAACHTAEVSGYLVEGHVPAVAVRRLLSERPEARGLAVPGMPAGSPGMEAASPQSYTVVLFGSGGYKPFMHFKGATAAEG